MGGTAFTKEMFEAESERSVLTLNKSHINKKHLIKYENENN